MGLQWLEAALPLGIIVGMLCVMGNAQYYIHKVLMAALGKKGQKAHRVDFIQGCNEAKSRRLEALTVQLRGHLEGLDLLTEIVAMNIGEENQLQSDNS
ncbi:hypothetical protein L6164_001996 [Bauhinia variegata]|uniref:Uncharacterized protein n=1 Tax=Bauhinia variegata TaxID=167791 RepID=A0ACB9PWT3_BAUVA|nr:hypothetical protein L6164_001996 [Bauhinia variegata]